MKRSAKIILPIAVIIIIFGIISIASSYNNMQKAQQEVIKSDQEVVAACQAVKDAMLNPNLPTVVYQSGLAHYNADCADKTGRLS